MGEAFNDLKIVKCDLQDKEKLIRVLNNTKYLIHTASADATGSFQVPTNKMEQENKKEKVKVMGALLHACEKAQV